MGTWNWSWKLFENEGSLRLLHFFLSITPFLDLPLKTQRKILLQLKDMGNDTIHRFTAQEKRVIHEAVGIMDNMLYNIYDLGNVLLYQRNNQ